MLSSSYICSTRTVTKLRCILKPPLSVGGVVVQLILSKYVLFLKGRSDLGDYEMARSRRVNVEPYECIDCNKTGITNSPRM
jgi:hypothetical protein